MKDHRCFKCFRETKQWGIDGLGVYVYPPLEQPCHHQYSNPTLDVCFVCLPKTTILEVVHECYRTRKILEPYVFLDGRVSDYYVSPCPCTRPCQRCHGSITLFYHDVGLMFYDRRVGPIVDYCTICYPKVTLAQAYQDNVAAWPQFELDMEKWFKEHQDEVAWMASQLACGSD